MPLVTGANTGSLYFQLKTGNGFVEIPTTGDFILQPLRSTYYSPVTGYYPFGYTKTQSDDFDGNGPINSGKFSVGADSFALELGGCNPEIGGYWGPFDTRKEHVIDSYGNIVFNKQGDYQNVINVYQNTSNSTIGGGIGNKITDSFKSVINGGCENRICESDGSVIAGGTYNYSQGYNNVIGGGCNNSTYGIENVILGGGSNLACSNYPHYHATILAGYQNCVYANISTILGGSRNQVGVFEGQETQQSYLLLGNGDLNFILGSNSTLLGGRENISIGNTNFIGGGYRNCIDTTSGNIKYNSYLWDELSQAGQIPNGAFIGNGYYNTILNSSRSSSILGGQNNRINNSELSAILNGSGNLISGAPNSFIIGSKTWIDNSLNQISGNEYIKVEGVGVLNDGSTLITNKFRPKTLSIGFRYGSYHYPFVNINNDPQTLAVDWGDEVKDYNNGLYGGNSGEYDGYTGVNLSFRYTGDPYGVGLDYGRLKMVNIGTNNSIKFHAVDISGFITGESYQKTLYRVYNPSVLIGSNNYGGHQNILIGVNNTARFTSIDKINTGLYGPGVSGIKIPSGIKTLNDGPWPMSSSTWPYYQGMNSIVGNYNSATGTFVHIFGSRNMVQDNAGPTLIAGTQNALLAESGIFLTGTNGAIIGYSGIGGYLPTWKKDTILLGFGNTERLGTSSNILGNQNGTYSVQSNVIGYVNNASGFNINILGTTNIAYGIGNSTFGNDNLVVDGKNNAAFGFNNIVMQLHPTGKARPINNYLLGNANYVIGSNGLLLGGKNRFGSKTGVYIYDSILVGNNNISEDSFNTVVGLYNYTSGWSSNIFGASNSISGGSNNGIFGFNNINFGKNSYSIGSDNKVYNEGGFALGTKAFSYNKNQISIAGGSNGTPFPGSSQKSHLFWKGVTSGASNMELMLDGVFHNGNYISGKAYIPSGVIWNGTINIIGSETGLGNAIVQTRYVSAANKNGFMHLINNTLLNSATTGTAPWGIGIGVDNTNKALTLTATGAASKVLYWSVVGEFNEAFIPTLEQISVDRFIDNSIVTQVIANNVSTPLDTESAAYPLNPRKPVDGSNPYSPF